MDVVIPVGAIHVMFWTEAGYPANDVIPALFQAKTKSPGNGQGSSFYTQGLNPVSINLLYVIVDVESFTSST